MAKRLLEVPASASPDFTAVRAEAALPTGFPAAVLAEATAAAVEGG